MAFADSYLSKQSFLKTQIKEPPSGLLRYIVIIPVYLEEDLPDCLQSLFSTETTASDCEVLIVFNWSESDTEENKLLNSINYERITVWCREKSTPSLRFYTIKADNLPEKHAGAGLARKIGMDEALRRFNTINCSEGLIHSLDADTLVDRNYFTAIEELRLQKPKAGVLLYQFAHAIAGSKYPNEVYQAMIQYELHLRYYKHLLQYTGFPYANYTIGSCFAVIAEIYSKQGGMNRRQAGEDFYFLNKVFPNTQTVTIKNSCVYPSSRPSTRVPFGTGPAIKNILKGENYRTYNHKAFMDLKQFFILIPDLYKTESDGLADMINTLNEPLNLFLQEITFEQNIKTIKMNTASLNSFTKRFFQWFDAFKIVKYLNYSHKRFYERVSVEMAVRNFFEILGDTLREGALEYLNYFRRLDRS